MMYLVIALTAMIAATLANHLGLTEAVSDIVRKIAKCPKCCSFWASLSVLWLYGCDLFVAVGLSLFVSYLSFWFGLILIISQKIYNKLWKRMN